MIVAVERDVTPAAATSVAFLNTMLGPPRGLRIKSTELDDVLYEMDDANQTHGIATTRVTSLYTLSLYGPFPQRTLRTCDCTNAEFEMTTKITAEPFSMKLFRRLRMWTGLRIRYYILLLCICRNDLFKTS